MRGRSFNPDDASRVKIIQGLIELRKDGQFHAIDANMNTVRIQFDVQSHFKLIGWRRAWEMVDTARRAAAGEPIANPLPVRKPPAAEGARRATAAADGSRGR